MPVLQRCHFWVLAAKVDWSQRKHTNAHSQEYTFVDYCMDFAAEWSATLWRAEKDSVYDHVNQLGTSKSSSSDPNGPVIIFIIICHIHHVMKDIIGVRNWLVTVSSIIEGRPCPHTIVELWFHRFGLRYIPIEIWHAGKCIVHSWFGLDCVLIDQGHFWSRIDIPSINSLLLWLIIRFGLLVKVLAWFKIGDSLERVVFRSHATRNLDCCLISISTELSILPIDALKRLIRTIISSFGINDEKLSVVTADFCIVGVVELRIWRIFA